MKRRIIAFAILLLVLVFSVPNTACATMIQSEDEDNGYTGVFVIVDSYSVTDERIIPGKPFTLTLVIKNASSAYLARKTLVTISNPDGVVPEYGKVSEFYLGDLEPGASETIELKYNTWSFNANALNFTVTITTNDTMHATTVRIPAGIEDPFSILSLEIPESGVQGDSLSASMTFKVLGENNRRDVTYIVNVDGQEAASSSIGIIKPGTTKNSAVAFSIPDAGQHEIEVKLRYTDESGQVFFMEAGKQTITINEKANQPTENEDRDYVIGNTSGPDYVGMGAMAGVIVLLFFTVVIILKKK